MVQFRNWFQVNPISSYLRVRYIQTMYTEPLEVMFFKVFVFLIETNQIFYLLKNFQHILQIFSIATQNFQKWMLSIYLSTENEGVDQFRGSHTATIHQLKHNELKIIKSVNFLKKSYWAFLWGHSAHKNINKSWFHPL